MAEEDSRQLTSDLHIHVLPQVHTNIHRHTHTHRRVQECHINLIIQIYFFSFILECTFQMLIAIHIIQGLLQWSAWFRRSGLVPENVIRSWGFECPSSQTTSSCDCQTLHALRFPGGLVLTGFLGPALELLLQQV